MYSSSSLFRALLRLSELEEGDIVIDGVNLKDVSLSTLRSSISIIPQDPVLFTGTVRSNLDPFHQYNDDFLWVSLL
ncbi:ATP-binding cassette domain-containing protein [archaeon]|nr:MAG: ATP-binding cassette domain-containing protein [archaeon]